MAGSFLQEHASNTPAPYRFELFNPDTTESVILKTEPLEWATGVTEIRRDLKIAGIFTEFVVDSLTFVNEGANFIRNIWNDKEYNGACELIISWWKFTTQNYVEMPSRYALNFATIKPRVKVGNMGIGVNVETVKKSELVKLENRRKKEVDLTKLKSVGGADIIDYTSLKKNLNFPSFDILEMSEWVRSLSATQEIENYDGYFIYTQFQMLLSSAEYVEAKEVLFETSITNINQIDDFFENVIEDRTVNFFYSITVNVSNRKGNIFNPQDVYTIFLEELSGGVVAEQTNLGEFGGHKGQFSFTGTIVMDQVAGRSYRIYIRTDAVDNVDAQVIYSYFKMYESVSDTSAKIVETFPIYEAFERCLQLNLDSQFPFYSEFFGRLSTPYNLSGDCYTSENQLTFCNLMTGLNLLGASLSDVNNPLGVSFDKLFNSVNCRYNIGYELELIDNFYRIRIEEYSYFFEDVEVLDISDRINLYDIETEAMPEYAYSGFESGYNDYEYEAINGRGEYNTDNKRTSIINTDSVFDNKSEIRGDMMAITQKLANTITTEDTKEDNSLFIIKTQRDGVNEWVPEFDTNIAIEDNSSLFGLQSLNLYFTPTRNLLRHGNKIKGAFSKYLYTYLRFQTAGKNQTLETTGEGYTIKENDDILVDTLDEPIYKPVKHIVTCKFTFDDLETLMSNPKGYITFSTNIKGYLLSLKKKNDEDRATIEIIEKI